MPNGRSRSKGYKGEYKARQLMKKLGFDVTWQAEDPKKPDIRITLPEDNFSQEWEVKYSASVPKTIYKWLEEKEPDALLVKRVSKKDGRSYPWLVIREIKAADQ